MTELSPQDGSAVEIHLGEEDAGLPAPKPGEVVLPAEDGETDALPENAAKLPDGRVALTLRYPVTLKVRIGTGGSEEKRFDLLKCRRLNGADMKFLATQPEDMRTVAAAAKSAGLRLDLMNALYEQMDGEDCTALDRVIGGFLGLGRKTGR